MVDKIEKIECPKCGAKINLKPKSKKQDDPPPAAPSGDEPKPEDGYSGLWGADDE